MIRSKLRTDSNAIWKHIYKVIDPCIEACEKRLKRHYNAYDTQHNYAEMIAAKRIRKDMIARAELLKRVDAITP